MAMLRNIQAGSSRWKNILLTRIAPPVTPLEERQINEILQFSYARSGPLGLATAAEVLTLQARNFPTILSQEVARALDVPAGLHRAAAMVLAGLRPDMIADMPRPDNKSADAFFKRLSSNHGLLEFHRNCGDLSTFLLGKSDWVKWRDQLRTR